MNGNKHYMIRTRKEWDECVKNSIDLTGKVIQDIDFIHSDVKWTEFKFDNTTFLGCDFTEKQAKEIIHLGAFVYPKFKNLPYQPYRQDLYTHQELLEGYSPENDQSVDYKIYRHFSKYKYNPPLSEAMAQRIHDFSIDEALRELLGYNSSGMTKKKAVGFMGGHSTRRGTEFYVNTALTAKLLGEAGYYVVTGGGPGIMEAANLGAYMAGKTTANLYEAVDILSDLKFTEDEQKDYLASNYIAQAQKVLERFPEGQNNLAIPTWFYGHEPTNLFASHIAKYFSNSIREDILLAISLYGVVYAPGSAGTTQEIFQEAAQNHYGTFGYYSPMIFLSKKRYVEDTSLYSVMHQLAKGQKYKELLFLTDSPMLAKEFILANPPVPVSK